MLPFLKLKAAPVSGLIIKRRKSDMAEGGSLDAQNEAAAEPNAGIETCAYALIASIQAQDAKAVANALRDIFTILESAPHEEAGESEARESIDLNTNSYKAQNVKAGQQY